MFAHTPTGTYAKAAFSPAKLRVLGRKGMLSEQAFLLAQFKRGLKRGGMEQL
jgi:hypothetical protein